MLFINEKPLFSGWQKILCLEMTFYAYHHILWNDWKKVVLSKMNIRKQVGGSLLISILSLKRTLTPTLAKTLVLSVLARAVSEGTSQIVKKISGRRVQSVGFMIPLDKIAQLMVYSRLLTPKQKRDVATTAQTGGRLINNKNSIRWISWQSACFDWCSNCCWFGPENGDVSTTASKKKIGEQHHKWECINHHHRLFLPGEKEWRKKTDNRKTRTATRKKHSSFNSIPILGQI